MEIRLALPGGGIATPESQWGCHLHRGLVPGGTSGRLPLLGVCPGRSGSFGKAQLRLGALSNGRWKVPSGEAPKSCLLNIMGSGIDSHLDGIVKK